MARPTLATHPKFAMLSHELGGRSVARGVLELIWDSAYASGEARIGTAAAVEAIADWRGEKGALAAALVSCGFLDVRGDGPAEVYEVHDLEDHAPDYVLKRWDREAKRRAAGDTIRSVRQKAARARFEQTAATDQQTDANGGHLHANGEQYPDSVVRLSATVLPPAPAPAPALDPPTPFRTDPPFASGIAEADPLTVNGIVGIIRAAVEAAHPRLGLYNQGRWALERATRFLEEIPEHRRTDSARAEIRARIQAFAASKDPWIKSKGWSVEAFFERYATLSGDPTRDMGPPTGLARYRDRPQLPKAAKGATNGPP